MLDTATPQVAALFQKAHGKVVMLQRVDQQIAALIQQRRRIQEEVSAVQLQINEEFDRIADESADLPAKLLQEITGTGRLGEIPAMEQSNSRQETPEPVGQFRDNE